MSVKMKCKRICAIFFSVALVLCLTQCSTVTEEQTVKKSTLFYLGDEYTKKDIIEKTLKNSAYNTVETIHKDMAGVDAYGRSVKVDPQKERLASQVLEYTDIVLGQDSYYILTFDIFGRGDHLNPYSYEENIEMKEKTEKATTRAYLIIQVVLKADYKKNKEEAAHYTFSGGLKWGENVPDSNYLYNNNYQVQKLQGQKQADLQKRYNSIENPYPIRIKGEQYSGSVRDYDREIFDENFTWRNLPPREMSLYIFVPYGTKKEDIDKFISEKLDKIDVYREFDITQVRFYHMVKGAQYKKIDHTRHYMAQSKVIDRCYNYIVNGGGQLVYSDEIFIG